MWKTELDYMYECDEDMCGDINGKYGIKWVVQEDG